MERPPLQEEKGDTTVTIQELIDAIGLPAMAESATDMLVYLAPEVLATGNSGKVVITLTVKPGKGTQLNITGKVALTMPKRAEDEAGGWVASLFRGEDGTLLTEDPQQPRLLKGA